MTFVKFINSITSYLVPVSPESSTAPLTPCIPVSSAPRSLSWELRAAELHSHCRRVLPAGPCTGPVLTAQPQLLVSHVLASPPPPASPGRGTQADEALEPSGAWWPHSVLESCALPHVDELRGMWLGFPSVSWPWGERKAAKIGLSRAVLPCSAGLSRAGRM